MYKKRKRYTLRQVVLYSMIGFLCIMNGAISASTDLTQFSLDDLISMQITSAAKKPQSISDVPAAIYVINQESIRRSGLTTIPELLRMVPGLDVAQVSGTQWAISSRGFNSRWANKLLVMIDGRTLYSPVFAGVNWDAVDVAIEDIDRIEVIRGSGGTLWGANAVNGIINIISKHSAQTMGGFATTRLGNQENALTMRYGAEVGERGWIRAYAKAIDVNTHVDADGEDVHDGRKLQHAGFRGDWDYSESDTYRIQGDIYSGESDQSIGYVKDINSSFAFVDDDIDLSGGNLLLSWRHQSSTDSEWLTQAYFDYASREDLITEQKIYTYDLDVQHRFKASKAHEITWGIGFRHLRDDIAGSFTVTFDPQKTTHELVSTFIQDEISISDNVSLSIGTKLEENDYTGVEYQPSARLLWNISSQHSLWSAVSRAVRTPSRSDRDFRVNYLTMTNNSGTTLFSSLGNKQFKSEDMLSYEWGYRGLVTETVSLDLTMFLNKYENLRTSESGVRFESTPAPPHMLIYGEANNLMKGKTYGLELSTNWQLVDSLRLFANYSWLKMEMELADGSTDTSKLREIERASPEHQVQLRTQWDIRHDLEWDFSLYYVDGVEAVAPGYVEKIPSYTRVDSRFSWFIRGDLELSLAAFNLFDGHHAEFSSNDSVASEVPRSFYGQIKLTF